MKKYFTAAVLKKLNTDLYIDKVIFSQKLSYGQVLIKIRYSGICGSQIGEIQGVKGPDKYLPHLLGHEASGIVVKCGEGVKKVKKNDKVIIHWMKTEGAEAETPNYKNIKNEKINAGNTATFSEYAIISENRITKILKGISLLDACLFGCTIPTAFGMLNNEAQLKIGEKVLIFGAGSIGQASAFTSEILGSSSTLVIDRHKKKFRSLKNYKTINCLLYSDKKSFLEELKRFQPDLIVETTGSIDVINMSYELLKNSGRLLLVGVPNYKKKIKINTLPLHFNTKMFGTSGQSVNVDQLFFNYQNFFLKRKINLKKIFVEKLIRLKDINKYISKIKDGQSTKKIIIDFG